MTDFLTDHFSYRGLPVATHQTGEGKPLIFLHGWGSSSRVLLPLAAQLAHLRKCLLIDFPGFGDSPEPPAAWSVDDYADLVEAYIDATGESSVDLIAHSYGGRITLKLLTRERVSSRIGKVLITGGAGLKPKRSLAYYGKTSLAKLLKAPLTLLPGELQKASLDKLHRSRIWKMLGSSDYRELSGTMRQTFVNSVNEHLDHLLPSIDHEVLLLWGDQDNATPLDQARRMEKGVAKSALVIMDGAGHYAFLDKPKRFASIAEAYLNG